LQERHGQEIAIAQAREEIAPAEPLEYGELDEDEARDFLGPVMSSRE